jgi:hypothetical protein
MVDAAPLPSTRLRMLDLSQGISRNKTAKRISFYETSNLNFSLDQLLRYFLRSRFLLELEYLSASHASRIGADPQRL